MYSLPGIDADNAHYDCKYRRDDIASFCLFLYEKATEISKQAGNIQYKARGRTKQKIAYAGRYRCAGQSQKHRPFSIHLVGYDGQYRCGNSDQLTYYLDYKLSIQKIHLP